MLEIHDELTTDDAKMARSYLRRVAGGVLLLVAAACTAVHVTKAYAQPMYEAKVEGVRIVLYDEPCALPEVTNLKLRAVWTEDGKDFEGCWAATPPMGLVMAYFNDKTVAAIPISAFQRVVGV